MPRTKRLPVPLLATVLAVAACGFDSTTPGDVEMQIIEELDFAASLDINLNEYERLTTGVYILDVELGAGDELLWGDYVSEVRYTGWLADGTQFDSGAFDFLMGNNMVIPGFEQGMFGMKKGGVRRIIIPPELGYGTRGQGSIPPGAVLVFEVELVQFNPFVG